MLKWEETHSGYHQLIEYREDFPNGNLVWATVHEMRVSTSATFEMTQGFGSVSETFVWSGPITFLSNRWRKFKRERALKKAKKWCDKEYKKYWDNLTGVNE